MSSGSSTHASSIRSAGWSPGAVLVLVALVWIPACLRLSIEWSLNAQYYYGWAVPFLAAYLAYERLAACPVAQAPGRWILPVAFVLACALPHPLLRMVGEANTDWRLISWLMTFSAGGISFGILYLAGGWGWVRQFAFPILFLATAVPWPTFLEDFLVQGLMRINAIISAAFVTFCGIPAVAQGNVIQLPNGGVLGVNEACSGIRSLQSTLMASIFLGGLYQLPMVVRGALVLFGVVMAFALNVVRTVFLSWQGAINGVEATEKWHDSAGFAILGAVLVLLWLASRFLEKRYGPTPSGKA